MDDKTKNKVQYVMYDPVAVGWEAGLIGVVEDAKKFNVPVAVKTEDLKEKMLCVMTLHGIESEVIVIEEK